MRTAIKRVGKHVPFANALYQACRTICGVPWYLRDFLRFRRLSASNGARFNLSWADRLPCLTDKTSTTNYDRHYLLHTAWAARKIVELRPEQHIDISSSLFFSAIVSAFVPIKFYDYRPAELALSNLSSHHADLYKLPFADQSILSLSCMHVVEHVGLGRYGDPLDPDGDIKAIIELQRVLAPGGQLMFVTPVGRPRIQFNAHRIYGFRQVLNSFASLRLEEFSLIPDSPCDGGLIINASEAMADAQEYGCGCFLFKR